MQGLPEGFTTALIKTIINILVTTLIEAFLIYFARLFAVPGHCNTFSLVIVERMTGWPLMVARKASTVEAVLTSVVQQIFLLSACSRIIVFHILTGFHAKHFMEKKNIVCRRLLAYTPISNDRVERIPCTMKKILWITSYEDLHYWNKSSPPKHYCYYRRHCISKWLATERFFGESSTIFLEITVEDYSKHSNNSERAVNVSTLTSSHTDHVQHSTNLRAGLLPKRSKTFIGCLSGIERYWLVFWRSRRFTENIIAFVGPLGMQPLEPDDFGAWTSPSTKDWSALALDSSIERWKNNILQLLLLFRYSNVSAQACVGY